MSEYLASSSANSDKKLSIHILLGDVSSRGGIERVSVSLANALADIYDAHIISLYKSNDKLFFIPNGKVKLTILNDYHELSMYNRKRNFLQGLFFDFDYIRKKKKRLSELSKNQNVLAITCDVKMTLLAKCSGYKNIIAIEHFEYDVINPVLKIIRKHLYQTLSKVVTLTSEDSKKYQWLANDKHIVIPNIVEIPSESLPLTARAKNVLAIGRYARQKGFDLLLQAWGKINTDGWTLNIVGEGPEKQNLEEMISAHQYHNVFLQPFTDDINLYYQNSQVFVLSSRYEGLGMVLIEALAHGLACISFNCPAGPKTILNKNNGLLVDTEDCNSLALAIEKMISDETTRQHYADIASSSIEEFTKTQVIKAWVKTIEQAVS